MNYLFRNAPQQPPAYSSSPMGEHGDGVDIGFLTKIDDFLSPAFGYALFYLKCLAPPHITMGTIFRSSVPFLIIQAIGLTLVVLFPEIILFLPRLVYGN